MRVCVSAGRKCAPQVSMRADVCVCFSLGRDDVISIAIIANMYVCVCTICAWCVAVTNIRMCTYNLQLMVWWCAHKYCSESDVIQGDAQLARDQPMVNKIK